MSDQHQDRTPSLGQQAAELTANPRVRKAAGVAFKAYLIWGAFVLVLALVIFGFVGYEFLHIGNSN